MTAGSSPGDPNATPRAFTDSDLTGLWIDGDFSLEYHEETSPSDELIASVEAELGGYKLPESYVELARLHKGGVLHRCVYPMDLPTNWADDHIVITGLYALGRTAQWSLAGPLGSTHMESEWGYPRIGIGIGDTPSAGHEQIMLDYRSCGKNGEPQVVHVDQEAGYRITFVAKDFATLIRGLVGEDNYYFAQEERKVAMVTVERGTLSPIVVSGLAAAASQLPDGERILRALARQVVEDKGSFALDGDGQSYAMYDLIFWLYSQLATARSFEDFVRGPEVAASYDAPCYELMIVFSLADQPYGFSTGGYVEDFLREWWEERVASGAITQSAEGFRLSTEAEQTLLAVVSSIG